LSFDIVVADIDHQRGIVDEDVDAAKGIGRRRRHGQCRRFVSDIDLDGNGPPATGDDLVGHRLRAFPIEIGDDDSRAGRRQTQGIGPADGIAAPAGASDDRDFAIKAELVEGEGHGSVS